MKNTIMYFYDLEPKSIHQTGKIYRFEIEDETYLFLPTNRSVKEMEDLYKITEYLKYYKVPIHQIIFNKQKKSITSVQNENYVLLKLVEKWKEPISFGDILFFTTLKVEVKEYKSLYRNDWHTLWSQKIDYFEYQVNQFGKKYPIIRESFSYFCGLAENAIQYTSFLKSEKLHLSHKRIKQNMCKLDLYNPLNFVIDYKVRDSVEYFKDRFFHGYLPFEEIEYFITYHLKEEEYLSFYTRMLFPSFYFDMYEEIMMGKRDEKELLTIIHKTEHYEKLLKKIYTYMSKDIRFLKPDWL